MIDRMQQAMFGPDRDDILVELWADLSSAGKITHSADTLPYTYDFKLFYSRLPIDLDMTEHEVAVRLIHLRKKGRCLAPDDCSRNKPYLPRLLEALERIWWKLIEQGKITRAMDDMAYTDDFEVFYSRTQAEFSLSQNEVWCPLMTLRKKAKCQISDDSWRNP